MLAAVLVGCSGNGQSTAALDELEASAAIDITYCRALSRTLVDEARYYVHKRCRGHIF